MPTTERSMPLPRQLEDLPADVRSTVRAAVRVVREAAPRLDEIACDMKRPASKSMMWKLVRYRAGDGDVAGIGTHGSDVYLYLHRGRELDDGSGILEGGGRTMRFIRLSSPADASGPQVRRLVREAVRLGAPKRSRPRNVRGRHPEG